MEAMKKRMYARWVVPADVTGDRRIQLRIKLEAGGSLLSVENVQGDELLGNSAMEALRAASPFPPMSGPIRCLSQRHLLTTWSTTLEN
jgi:membrane protein involved in colicin uptake